MRYFTWKLELVSDILRVIVAPTIFRKFFSKRSVQYNLRHASEFSVPNVKSTFHGTESLSYLGPKIWDLLPKELKEPSSLSAFKKAIKK